MKSAATTGATALVSRLRTDGHAVERVTKRFVAEALTG